jgi:NADP-dependent 3-hydroxy acid dehydrogenase YdfG/Tfp pilus assembly protein PilF
MNSDFVFIYCAENQSIATKFTGDLASSGANFILVDAAQNDNVSAAMSGTNPAILLLTDNFLKNQNCLVNAYSTYSQAIRTGRLIVIVAEGYVKNADGSITTVPTQIERVTNIIYYMNYWQDQYLEMRKKANDSLVSEAEATKVKSISSEVNDLMGIIKSSTFYYYENLTMRNYQQFCQMAGLPMPTNYLPKVENETQIENTPIVAPAVVETPVVPTITTGLANKSESEDDIIESVLNDIPGLELLKDEKSQFDAVAVNEIDEDDFFEEKKPEVIQNSNMTEIMDEVVAEEEEEELLTTAPEIIDIEEIFETEAEAEEIEEDEINQIFNDIHKQHHIEPVVEPMPSESNNATSVEIEVEEDDDNSDEKIGASDSEESDDELLTLDAILANEKTFEGVTEAEPETEEAVENVNEIDKFLTTNERLQAALEQAKSQNYKAATQNLEIILNENPNNHDAYFLLAEVAELNRDFISAMSYYEKVADLSPYYPNIHFKLAQLSKTTFPDNRKQTKRYFKRAIDLDESNADILYAYAEFLNEKEDSQEKAIKYFKRTLRQNPKHPFATYDLATIFYNIGDKSTAYEYYLSACEINPELATAENDEAFKYSVLNVERAGEAINIHSVEEDEKLTIIEPVVSENVASADEDTENSIATPTAITANEEVAVIDETIDETSVETAVEPLEETKIEQNTAETNDTTIESETIETEQNKSIVNKYKPVAGAKIVLITGATAGIGKATAERFAQNGYNLILTGRREERLIAMQNEFHEKYDGACIILPFDIQHFKEIETTFANLSSQWKAIDVLVNNAGLALGMDPIHEGKIEHWEAMIDTNIKGLLYMTRLISPQMVERRSGHIINLSSTAGKEAYPNGNIYCATKFAVEALTRSMRIDLHKYGIRVGQVSPGAVETEFSNVRFEGDAERAAKIYADINPLTAEDIANVIFYVASAPPHVNIQDVLLMPTQQASAVFIDRSGRE